MFNGNTEKYKLLCFVPTFQIKYIRDEKEKRRFHVKSEPTPSLTQKCKEALITLLSYVPS